MPSPSHPPHLSPPHPGTVARAAQNSSADLGSANSVARWAALFCAGRETLGNALTTPAADATQSDDHYALQLAWTVEVDRLPHEAERALRQRPLAWPALQSLLQSRFAQMYDDAAAARREAERALLGLADPLHPTHQWAQFALGLALLEDGWPALALHPLRVALRGANRDGLAWLALDVVRAMARVHDEMGDDAATEAAIAHGQTLVADLGAAAQHCAAADSLARLREQRAWRQRLTQPPPPTSTPTRLDIQLPTPHLIQAATSAFAQGHWALAQQAVAVLRQRRAHQYCPHKWLNELAWLDSALAARDGTPWRPAPPDQGASTDTLYGLQAKVLEVGSAAMQGQVIDEAALQTLADGLSARGLRRLEAQLALLRALVPPNPAALVRWLGQAGADGMDLLRLAPLAAAPWAQLLVSPELAAHTALIPRAQALARWLNGPGKPMGAAILRSAPPADLTAREWEVLQLIGHHLSNEQIAARLFLAPATVKTHINRIYGKLGLHHRGQAIQRAQAWAAQAT